MSEKRVLGTGARGDLERAAAAPSASAPTIRDTLAQEAAEAEAVAEAERDAAEHDPDA